MEEEPRHVRALPLATGSRQRRCEKVLPACQLRPKVAGSLHSLRLGALPPSARHPPNFVKPLRGEFVAADIQKPDALENEARVVMTQQIAISDIDRVVAGRLGPTRVQSSALPVTELPPS